MQPEDEADTVESRVERGREALDESIELLIRFVWLKIYV